MHKTRQKMEEQIIKGHNQQEKDRVEFAENFLLHQSPGKEEKKMY